MAQLTATLNTEQRGKSIVEGQKAAPGFLQGLAGFANDFLQGAGQRQSQAAASAAAAKKARTEGALNELASASFNALNAANSSLRRTQNAENQGRLPAGSTDVQLEKVFQDFMSNHPEDVAAGAKWLKEQGWSSWMLQDITAAKTRQESIQSAETKAYTDDIDYATNKGIYNPDLSAEQNRTAGQQARQADVKLAEAKAAAEEARKAAEEGRTSFKFDQARNDREAFGAISQGVDVEINQLFPTIQTYITTAVGDPDKEKRLSESLPVMSNWIETKRAEAKAKLGSMATPELTKMIDDKFDGVRKSLEEQFSGGLSQFKVSQQVMSQMKTTMGLDFAESFPVYSKFVSYFGRETANTLLGGDLSTAFPPNVAKQIQAELKGFTGEDAAQGRVHLMNLSRLLRGDLGIHEMSEQEAIAQMPALAKSLQANQAAIISKTNETPQAYGTWGNAYGNIVNAVTEVQPGQAKVDSLWAGSKFVFNEHSRTILGNMFKNPALQEQTQALIQGSRGAAQQAFLTAQHSPPTYNQFQKERWNSTTHRFEFTFDEQAFRRFQEKGGTGLNQSGSSVARFGYLSSRPNAADYRNIDSQTRDRLSVMTASVEHLVKTAQYDPEVPKGATEKQLYEHYARGVPFVTAGGKPMLSSDQEFINQMDKFDAQVRTSAVDSAQKITEQTPITNIKFASDDDAIVRTAILEAGNQGPEGLKAVISTILNRQDSGKWGSTASEVVLAKNQFEPWNNASSQRRGLNIDPASKEYQNVQALLNEVRAGAGRTPFMNFLNKDIVTSRGDPIPDWASGKGTQIGQHTFY